MSTRTLLLGGAAIVAALGAGYWLGRSGQPHQTTAAIPAAESHTGHDPAAQATKAQVAKERQIMFYQHPDGIADYSPVPKKDDKGRDYTPVYADPEPEPVTAKPAGVGPQSSDLPAKPAGVGPQSSDLPAKPAGKGKILYYRNPMGLADTSPVPKKDGMGMDYVPVYEGDDDGSTLKVSLDKVQKLGVRTEAARLTTLARSIRAVGSVQVNERNLFVVAPKFEGYIERLNVNQTGQAVKRGQSLMEVYSPDLVLAEQEFVVAAKGAQSLDNASPEARDAARSLADGALARLKNWDVPPAQIEKLRQGGQPSRTLSFTSPATGIVLEKRAVQGMRFMPGEMLYQIADLSTVWVIAEVFEQDLAQVSLGQVARVNFNALPGLTFTGKVTFLYPTVTEQTRTVKVRIELPNHEDHLKPALYGAVELSSPVADRPVLAVPDSAVLDSGTKQAVLVEKGEGRFEPREVKSGIRANGLIEIRGGLAEGEKVVVHANFLIDAESNLRAALQSFHNH